MDKIYSRKRIKLPKVKNKSRKKLIKVYCVFLIWLIIVITIVRMLKTVDPIFEKICKDECKKIGTEILNIESTKVLKDYKYEDFIIIDKNSEGKINYVNSNVLEINLAASDIAYNIQQALNVLEKEEIKLAMGSLSGVALLSGFGPDIKIKIVPGGSVDTKFESEFLTAGVNQTLHRLYLVVDCEIMILTNYKIINSKIRNEVLFAENIITGEVPSTYYNLEGIKSNDVLEVVN